MNILKDFIVFRDRENGAYLASLKSQDHSLATKAEFYNDINAAATMSYESYLIQKEQIKALAKVHNCEIVRVKANYELTSPNGSDISEIMPTEKKSAFQELLEAINNV